MDMGTNQQHVYNAVKRAYRKLDKNKEAPKAEQHKTGDSSLMGKRNVKDKAGGEDITLHYMRMIRKLRGEN
jgi:hypothetical protein|tara:strand:- start:277 stop:489 length:213 start_codon:yes stop_codon:yes gene_type:complete